MRWNWLMLMALGGVTAALPSHAQSVRASASTAQRDRAGEAEAVQAATRKAVENLYLQVRPMPLTSAMTVGQYVDYMEARDDMLKGLETADQIGGPRWTGAAVSVNLEIPAVRVKSALNRIAAARPRVSPLRVDQIERMVDAWPRRSFSATGASAGMQAVMGFRPRTPQWQGVEDEVREKALAAATNDAVDRAVDAVRPVKLSGRATIESGLAIPEVNRRIREWLSTRQVTQVRFREEDGLSVEMVLGVNEADYFQAVKSAFAAQQQVPFPDDPEELKRVERDFYTAFRPAVGRASVKRDQAKAGPRKDFAIPQREPDWVERTISVQGVAPFTSRQLSAFEKLRVMGRAEQDAQAKMRARLEALSLDGTTVGEAAKQDPRVEAALRRCLGRAAFSKANVRSGETATADMSLELRVLWDELRR